MNLKKVLIVGAGPAGSTVARILAEHHFHVDLYDERNHIAGNCFDTLNTHGHLIHRYGPHYFRTNSDELFSWLSQFTEWIPGEYYVQARVHEKNVPLPISLATMEKLKNRSFTKEEFEDYLRHQRQEFKTITNAEEQCLSNVGKELYELFFKNYTTKQWGVPPRELEPSVTARIPLRFDYDVRYPTEKYQFLPKSGYTEMFRALLHHPFIHLHLRERITSQWIYQHRKQYHAIVYTGPIDSFFNHCFGKLIYRSLRFEWIHLPHLATFQPTVQCNFPNEQEYTRIVETKHITKIAGKGTTLCYEYPCAEGEPFYPMPIKFQQEKYHRYYLLSQKESTHNHPIYFLGRLAEYKYYNMDHIFLRAQSLGAEIVKRFKA